MINSIVKVVANRTGEQGLENPQRVESTRWESLEETPRLNNNDEADVEDDDNGDGDDDDDDGDDDDDDDDDGDDNTQGRRASSGATTRLPWTGTTTTKM